MTTRADVAKLAGVSESTVSYVLSGKRPIGEKTKKRVFAAIEASGYRSNYAASALAGGSPRLVTMMISNLFTTPSSRINGALVDGIVDGVRESGFHSVIWPVSNDDDSDVELLLNSNFSGGVILMNFKKNDKRVDLLNSQKIPFVVLGRTEVGFEYNYVDRDFATVYEIALTNVKDHGHIDIGVIMADTSLSLHLKKIAKALKLNLYPINIPNTLEGGIDLARNLRVQYPNITALISLIDAAPMGFVNSAAEFGISIPNDISIIGINMLEDQAESTNPKMSTVAFDAYQMAKACGTMMVQVIEAGKDSKEKQGELWVGDFIDRGSTTAIGAKQRK